MLGCWNPDSISDMKSFQESLEKIKAERKKAEKEKYWSEHKEERAVYEEELKQKQDERVALSNELERMQKKLKETVKARDTKIPEETECEKIQEQIMDLKIKKANLGGFKNKEKKDIDSKIAELEMKEEKCRVIAERKRRDYNRELEPVILPIQGEIYILEDKIKEVIARISEIQKKL